MLTKIGFLDSQTGCRKDVNIQINYKVLKATINVILPLNELVFK